jgi:hypothetical protein
MSLGTLVTVPLHFLGDTHRNHNFECKSVDINNRPRQCAVPCDTVRAGECGRLYPPALIRQTQDASA